MKEEKAKVLIVDDVQVHHTIYERFINEHGFKNRVRLIPVFAIEEANKFFMLHPDARIVAIDAEPPTISKAALFVSELRSKHKYKNPLISISHHGECRRVLLNTGCSHACGKDKLGEMIVGLMNSLYFLNV